MPEAPQQLGAVDVEQAVGQLKQHSVRALKCLRCISYHAGALHQQAEKCLVLPPGDLPWTEQPNEKNYSPVYSRDLLDS